MTYFHMTRSRAYYKVANQKITDPGNKRGEIKIHVRNVQMVWSKVVKYKDIHLHTQVAQSCSFNYCKVSP